ncbi:L-cystine transporter [Ferrimonas aestuarii]|uniref:L-cystine transporter n=1 Tax=Ferrimonas aestuarii TaxID=2569539 RepID=A0A4U1BTX5_9GAMM|nr:L-cystine transporter [Ferrimonas aestuarii]TKB56103.1 L-cystine transporter [Ferrimonas aestuarii]
MSFLVMANVAVMLLLLFVLYRMQQKHVKFTRRVFAGLGMGIGFGLALQLIYGVDSQALSGSIEYFNIVGSGYVQLLKMIVMPLVMVSIISAILKLKDADALGKISGLTIGILLITVAIAGLIGFFVANLFGLTAEGLTQGAREAERASYLMSRESAATGISIASTLVNLIPANPFLDMTGARDTSIISVVIFSAFVGIAGLGLHRKQPDVAAKFDSFIEVAYAIVMRIVTLVLRLTPYGVMALMTKVLATSQFSDIFNLISFVGASYLALALMFLVHLALVTLVGGNPVIFVKKVLPVLTFAFTSRTSAGTIPLNVQTQTQRLGIPDGIANLSASFGATIGQNGCAGIYPAMLVAMIAPTIGIDPMTPTFIATLIATIVVGSFGVAGVGGGATFAALIVLTALDMPVALAGLLISIEPLIDMGRTALNVNGAMTAGFVTSRVLGQTDMEVYHGEQELDVDLESA